MKSYELKDFIRKSIETHGDHFDYSLSVYNGCEKKLIIICKKCNYKFEQEPRHHMRGSIKKLFLIVKI